MNLTDIQIELRAIEDRLSALQVEIEEMKPKDGLHLDIDFAKIDKVAKNHPINHLKICKAHEMVKKSFITGLAHVATYDKENIVERLVYVRRLAYGCQLEIDTETIYRKGIDFEEKAFEALKADIKDYASSFFVEAFILANVGALSTKTISLIADIAEVFGFGKADVRVLGMVAKSVLLNNLDVLDEVNEYSPLCTDGSLYEYIDFDWVKNHRKHLGRVCKKVWAYNKLHTRWCRPIGYKAFYDYRKKELREQVGSKLKIEMKDLNIAKYQEAVVYGEWYSYDFEYKALEDGYEDKKIIATSIKILASCNGFIFTDVELRQNMDAKEDDESDNIKNDTYMHYYIKSIFDNGTKEEVIQSIKAKEQEEN